MLRTLAHLQATQARCHRLQRACYLKGVRYTQQYLDRDDHVVMTHQSMFPPNSCNKLQRFWGHGHFRQACNVMQSNTVSSAFGKNIRTGWCGGRNVAAAGGHTHSSLHWTQRQRPRLSPKQERDGAYDCTPAAANISLSDTCFALVAPRAVPAASSAASNRSQAFQSTTLTPLCCSRACSAGRPGAVLLKVASSKAMLCTVSSASVRFVPMMPVGPRFSQPHTYMAGMTSDAAAPTPAQQAGNCQVMHHHQSAMACLTWAPLVTRQHS